MSRPCISVIVPVYRVEEYLEACVDSIRKQTYENLEILLVDDGSPDGSGALCDALAEQDHRIRVIHKENGGLSSARNAGLDAATGEYVSFVDSDDWIAGDMYERLYGLIATHGAQIAAGGLQTSTGKHYDPEYPQNQQIQLFTRMEALGEVTRNRKITNSACDKLWEKHLFDTVRFPEGELFEDLKTTYRCLELVETVAYDPTPVYFYRMTDSSITRGQFHPRLLEDVYATKARARYYQEKYPALYEDAVADYIHICLFKIWLSRRSKACRSQRRALIREMKGTLPPGAVQKLSTNGRIKLRALRLSVPLFYLAMALNEWRQK